MNSVNLSYTKGNRNNRAMNALYTIRHKGKIACLLLLLICLEILNAVSHENNISEMATTFSSVYKDRLLAHDYLYKLEGNIYDRKLDLLKGIKENKEDVMKNNQDYNSWELIANYEHTEITKNEKKLLNEFKIKMVAAGALEQKIIFSNDKMYQQRLLLHHDHLTNSLLAQLHKLSQIQMTEGKQLNDNSERIMKFSGVLSQFNWALIIIIGLAIQALVFASKSSLPKLPQNEHLN